MAIFYNHIKGCGAGSTGEAGSVTDLWTWIKWANPVTNDGLKAHVDFLPEIRVSKENDKGRFVSCGKIITSDAENQSINKILTFNEMIRATLNKGIHFGESGSIYEDDNSFLQIHGDTIRMHSLGDIDIIADYSVNINNGVVKIRDSKYNIDINGTSRVKKLHVGTDDTYAINGAEDGTLKVDQKCEARYFNAVSDRRAKSNITPAEFSALSVINTLPIYTFQYLNNPEPVIGLIAQEAAEHNLDGFNMVANLDANGEFGDYIHLKESKLVYVLWKAVQELSAEVEELKAEIRNLK